MYTNVSQYGSKLYVRSIDQGTRHKERISFAPLSWADQPNIKQSNETHVSPWTTLFGEKVYPIRHESIEDFKSFNNNMKDVSGIQLYQSPGHQYQYIAQAYPDAIQFNISDLLIYTIDIETETEYGFPDVNNAQEKILLITLHCSNTDDTMTWGIKPFDNPGYRYFESESDMLQDFITWWHNNSPDIITGWNTRYFDIPYLYNRLTNILGEYHANKLSPFGICNADEVKQLGNKIQTRIMIVGISDLDYLELYKKFTYTTRESYKLDFIAQVELNEQKHVNPGSSFKDFYVNHWDTFVRYNIQDTKLVVKLEQKMKLIELAITLAYESKINFEDVFSPVRTWDVIIYNYLNARNIVIPPKRVQKKNQQYQGAYVKEPLTGKHNWCVSFDINSLYPLTMVQYNMSPETIAHEHVDIQIQDFLDDDPALPKKLESFKQYAVAASGACFIKDKRGMLPELVNHFYDLRVVTKDRLIDAKKQLESLDPASKNYLEVQNQIASLNNMQMAYKILINSLYGAVGSPYFRYYDVRIAEGITVSGQLAIRHIAKKLNQFFNGVLKDVNDRVILIDTDSVVLGLNDLVQQVYKGNVPADPLKVIHFLDIIAEQKIVPVIAKGFEELASLLNVYENKMIMKREALIDVMISCQKKSYAMSVYNSEGVQYKTPKMKIMGLQMIKSSTPGIMRDRLREALEIILRKSDNELQSYVKQIETKYSNYTIDEIAFPRKITDTEKYHSINTIYSKGCPIHVRGALLYNHYVVKLNLIHKYKLIQNLDNIKFVYLKIPNPINEDCIAFLGDGIPSEFNLDQYIDYKKMFEKTFFIPVNDIMKCLGKTAKQTASLAAFFDDEVA